MQNNGLATTHKQETIFNDLEQFLRFDYCIKTTKKLLTLYFTVLLYKVLELSSEL